MIAIDANAVVALLVDDGKLGAAGRRTYAQHDFAAPDLLPYEVTSVLRRLCKLGTITVRAAEQALRDLTLVRISYATHGDVAARTWELRDNLSAYDGSYVAVAELFDVPLLTFDRRIHRAHSPRCEFVAID